MFLFQRTAVCKNIKEMAEAIPTAIELCELFNQKGKDLSCGIGVGGTSETLIFTII